MKAIGLTNLISRLPALESLYQRPRPSRVYGLLNAAKPAVVAALCRQHSGPVLIVTAHPQAAQEWAEELAAWTDRDVLLFPAIESLPYERVHVDRTVLSEREAVASRVQDGSTSLVVAPIRALLQPVNAKASSDLTESRLVVGMDIRIERLIASWVQFGYADVPEVDEPGTFARRGGVIDVFPAGSAHPVRLELFGNQIESLRSFDPATQRSLGPVAECTVMAIASADEETRLNALEALMNVDASGMNAEAQTRWLDDLGRLETGVSLDELALFAPYLAPQARSLAEVLPSSSLVIVDSADTTMETMADLWQQSVDLQRELEEAGDLPRDLRPALLQGENVMRTLKSRDYIEFHAGTGRVDESVDLSGVFTPARLYSGRIKSFVHDIAEGVFRRVLIATHQGDRIEELLQESGLASRRLGNLPLSPEAGVTILPASPAEGWTLASQGLTVITDYELFGRARTRSVARKPRPARSAFFADYSPGDYVVHVEHGIGRFQSITRMSMEGAEREYALVEYAGSDRLYVPSDQLERLTRYVGLADSAPALNRLGGGEWQRARQRAEQAAAEIAGELIDLYSKRMARPGFAFTADAPWQGELESSFPYPETPDQLKAVEEVKRDMETPRPMDRLVCADVGYGKTEVAVRAAFKSVLDGRQVAVLVPTTILAQQHYETFTERFEAFPVRVEVISRFRSRAEQREILRKLAIGEVDVLIGTHRLLQSDVIFKDLGLLVIDEEQRFGVRHKEKLKKLRETIDVLTLTATPIPRTLHMGLVGIREISVIETPPEGRLAIKTYLQPFEERLVREAILRELDRDGQVYIVHNKVATIEAMAERLRRLVPEARILVGHGQMDEAQLERVMLDFAHHKADVLLCSTIIENGLDIPNVNTIVVNNAHRLGLTQLYQLRGRVGRSANQAYAYLLYPADVRLSHDAERRMEAVFEAQELGAGFSIAMRDLEIRGTGNLLGAQQSGHASAVGFDLFTRMIGDAVESLRGNTPAEPVLVTLDLPLTMFLPPEYVGNESERLALYRRLAAVADDEALEQLRSEMIDRFGTMPQPVENLIASVRLKLLAVAARITSISLNQDALILRAEGSALYDRVSLYRKYGMDAKISTNVLRVPRRLIGADWMSAIRTVLHDMIELRSALDQRQPVGA